MDRTTFRVCARWAAVASWALFASACGLQNQEMPSLIGPAETGLSITLSAAPDQLPRDGNSQSVVTIIARDSVNRPIVGQRLLLALAGGSPLGSAVSQSEVTTNSQGAATFAVSAPAQGSTGNSIVVTATPVGSNADSVLARRLSIAVTPANAGAPVAGYTFSPAAPEIGQVVTFDASTTTDEGASCTTCTFLWSFGGDGTGSGRIVTHAFPSAGPYAVSLVAVDSVGTSSATLIKTVTVTGTNIPTGMTITSSPNPPVAKQAATFTANATAAANHRIVQYQWAWGDGDSSTTSGSVFQHTYSQGGPVLVTLTVRDDLGQAASASSVFNVASGLTATFTFAPANPTAGQTVTFNAGASTSTVASTITDYAWDFDGDGTYDTNGPTPIATQSFASGTWRVLLKITDNRGVSQVSAAQTITVP